MFRSTERNRTVRTDVTLSSWGAHSTYGVISQCFPFPDKSVTTASPTEATPSRGFRVIVATTPLVATESIVSAVVYSTMHLVTD